MHEVSIRSLEVIVCRKYENEGTYIGRRGIKRRQAPDKENPPVRVPRAETRLTVYRLPLVQMLTQLVRFARVERAGIKVDVFLRF
jgi:hypothetical protein